MAEHSWKWQINDELRFLSVSDDRAEVFGFPAGYFAGKSILDQMDPAYAQQVRSAFYSEDNIPQSFRQVICRYTHSSGSVLLTEISGAPLVNRQGQFLGFTGTERMIAAFALNAIAAPSPHMETMYGMAPVALCVVDRSGRLLAANDRHTQLLGSCVGHNVAEHHPRSAEKIREDFRALDEGRKVPDHEIRVGEREYAVSVTPLPDATGNIIAISVAHFDITERRRLERLLKEANEQLAAQAIRDHLTGAFNRRYFDDALESEIQRIRRQGGFLSVVMIDIDNFKKYNDTYGHVAGDHGLISVVEAMAASLEDPGFSLFRYGGEEFAVLLPGADAEQASEAAEGLRRAVHELALEHAANQPYGCVTISAGVATCQYEAQSIDLSVDPILAADEALYRAKMEGRNRFVMANTENALAYVTSSVENQ